MPSQASPVRIVRLYPSKNPSNRALREMVRFVWREEGVEPFPLEVVLADEATLQKLHGRFLGEERPTDVLAFPLGPAPVRGATEATIVLSAERARRIGGERGFVDELMLYLVHGLLHLLGYRDQSQREARTMHRRSIELLRARGYHPRPP